MGKLIHRDDVDPSVLKQLEVAFPGMKIIFAGGHENNLSPEILKDLAEFERQQAVLLCEGRCSGCFTQIPNWEKIRQAIMDETEVVIPEGWRQFIDRDEAIVAWQCPDCDAKEEEHGKT